MKDWYAVFSLALVIIIGAATGLSGTVAFLLAFFAAWYLLTAREIGFARAQAALDIRIEPPVLRRSNWLWLERLFDDSGKLLKAAAIALIVMACALMFGVAITFGTAVLIAAYFIYTIHRDRNGPPPRAVRIHDAGADVAARAARNASLPPTPKGPTSTLAQPVPAPAIVTTASAAPQTTIARPALDRLRAVRKPAPPRNQRPIARGAAGKAARKRPLRKQARRLARTLPPMPRPRIDYPVQLKSRKPPRPRPPVRQRRRVRRPMTLVPRSGSAPKP
jgi:hypothetical protein